MANTFFRAMGLATGRSLVEEDRIEMARRLLDESGERLVIPVDCIVSDRLDGTAPIRAVSCSDISDSDIVGDVGPRTRALYAEIIGGARTVVWNGPMGVFEVDVFSEGTVEVARAIADACDGGATGVIGGGDSGAAAERAGVLGRLSHVSTGGGASLELLAGAELPGVESLSDQR